MITGKIWGSTEELLVTPFVEVHRAFAKKGGVCSTHIHEYKSNYFYVEKGHLLIEEFRDNGLVDRTFLKDGDSIICPPNNKHRFIAIEDTVFYEVYYPEPIGKVDIKRDNTGFLMSQTEVELLNEK